MILPFVNFFDEHKRIYKKEQISELTLFNHHPNSLYDRKQLKKIRGFLSHELNRSIDALQSKKPPRVYYLSYLFRNRRSIRLWGRLGAVCEHVSRIDNTVYCDLRVGSFRYDNVANGGLEDNSTERESVDYISMPLEVDQNAYRFALWRLTDSCYRESVEQYYSRKSEELHYLREYPRLPSKVKPEKYQKTRLEDMEEIDLDYWSYLIRKAGLILQKYHGIKNSWLEFCARQKQQIFLNSEGSDIWSQSTVYELRCSLWYLKPRGEGISQEISLITGKTSDLPSEKDFIRMVQERIKLLLDIQSSSKMNSYSGPVLLDPEPSGVFFHEVVGHRLEGSRLLSREEGATFLDLRGKQVAPEYIDMIDDPLQKSFQGKAMIGHFAHDDEGNHSKRTILIENGKLKNFLSTSAPLPYQNTLNGHARNQSHERPISRMGNLFVINRKPLSNEELRSLFLQEIRNQKKHFGIHIKEVLGGETKTDTYDFQAFKGKILHAVKVFPNGKEELVRGIDFIGTPLSALGSVKGMGSVMKMYNSFCGAESGIIPVSTIAPSVFLKNLELQSTERSRFTQFVLPLPY